MNDAQVFAEAAVMGAVAGMRAMSAPAVVSKFSDAGLIPEDGSPIAWLQHPAVGTALKVLATGELVADKLPFVPARTQAGPLAGRALSGGIGGAAIFTATKRPWWMGALIGAAAAVGASFGAYKLRKWVTEEQHIPNTVVGLVEDAVAAGFVYVVMSSLKAHSQDGARA